MEVKLRCPIDLRFPTGMIQNKILPTNMSIYQYVSYTTSLMAPWTVADKHVYDCGHEVKLGGPLTIFEVIIMRIPKMKMKNETFDISF